MDRLFIDPTHPGYYYILFNIFTYAVGIILLFLYGRKIKLPTLPWLLTITSAFLFFVVGCKVLAMQASDWNFLLQNNFLPRDPGRSLLGGLAFGIIGILLGRWYFKLPWKSLDAFAWVFPVGIATHRVGCFIAGCCFGTSTEVPWAVLYGSHTGAFHKTAIHTHELIVHSPALHPVQLYESLLTILIIPIIWMLRKKFTKAGSLLGLAVVLYLTVRLFTEFFRFHENQSDQLDYTPWILLSGILIISLAVLFIENISSLNKHFTQTYSGKKAFFYFLFISVLLLPASIILLPFEMITIQLAFVPCLLILLIKIFKVHTAPEFRIASVTLLAVSFLFMSQAFPEFNGEKTDEEKIKKYHNIYTGYYGGQIDLLYQSLDCSGDPIQGTDINYLNAFNILGAGYEQTIVYPKSRSGIDQIKFGVQGFKGRQLDRATGIINDQRHLDVFGVTPFIKLESGKWETGLGATIGDFALINPFPDGTATALKRYWMYPMVSLRYGELNVWYVEVKIGDYFPSAFPGLNTQLATGFMDKDKRNGFRFGMASAAGIFVNPQIYLSRNLSVDPLIGFLPSAFISYEEQQNFQFSLKLNYKFEDKRNKD
jgi:prolipoprotein diacylglyceryltransferase